MHLRAAWVGQYSWGGYAGRADMEAGLPEHPRNLQMQITPTIELVDKFYSQRIPPDGLDKERKR
jgi:hypothetical protein